MIWGMECQSDEEIRPLKQAIIDKIHSTRDFLLQFKSTNTLSPSVINSLPAAILRPGVKVKVIILILIIIFFLR